MKYIAKIIIMTLIITTTLICKGNLNKTLAHTYTIKNTTLFYEEDKTKLAENIKLYLEDIDDLLIPNTSFNYSEILTNNYENRIYNLQEQIYEWENKYNDLETEKNAEIEKLKEEIERYKEKIKEYNWRIGGK